MGMLMTTTEAVPVTLPESWKLDSMPGGEVVIEARHSETGAFLGCISVSEEKRNFSLGAVTVKAKGTYGGRGWKKKLYADAVQHLKQSFEQ
ncbi:hypothetical protein MSSD14B_23200 [Marinobacter salsuginis]|jgi:hypothetical protein|uniref:Uncharacterized protein n=2 Tax=Marinobacter salsuginis TaxID=418719 RepID=A0A5M3Q0P7_9GAMM|nr:hypothetical protein MSSD14B_23200 [Marinobacter salsuginis]